MTEARTRAELEARAAQIEAELESRKSASQKAADRFFNPPERGRRDGWQSADAAAVDLVLSTRDGDD